VTVVMVSHSMEDVSRLATRIAVMNHGGLAMLDAPGEVFSHGPELSAMGLDVPPAVQLAHALRARGMEVPKDVYQMHALRDWLVSQLGREAT